MEPQEKQLSEKESLDLIAMMIHKAKDSFHDTGVSLIMWGAVVAFCSLEKLAEIQFSYRLPFDIFLLTLLAVIPQIFLSIKEKKERKVKAFDDVYLDYIWLAFGISIMLMIFIINNIYANLSPVINEYRELTKGRVDWIDFRFSEFVPSLFLLLYGVPTFITGAACRFKPMLWGGLICWASSIAAIYTHKKIDLFLIAFSAITGWLIPGILMEIEYRKAKRELKEMNV